MLIDKVFFLMLLLLLTCCKEVSSEQHQKNSRVEHLPYYKSAEFTPNWLESNSEDLMTFHQISAFQLINQFGENITEKTFENKIYVTDFFFTTCPGICPQMTENMKLVQDEFLNDDDVLLLSHSVTPETDTPAILNAYAKAKGVKPNKWHLVTGDRQLIYKLGRKDYFVEENMGTKKGPDDFLHTENFVLVDKNRHIRGIYNGLNKTAIHQLIADIKTLKKQATS